MMLSLRLSTIALLAFIASPAAAKDKGYSPPDAVSAGMAMVEEHQVDLRVGCSVPVPAVWNAPPWQQRAAEMRRQAFERCLDNRMRREQDRLAELTDRLNMLRAEQPDMDWSGVDYALENKWAELDTLSDRLNTRGRWADTAVNILDTFTGPGAPFDTSGARTYSPHTPYTPYAPYSPYGYRRDSSVSAPGIR